MEEHFVVDDDHNCRVARLFPINFPCPLPPPPPSSSPSCSAPPAIPSLSSLLMPSLFSRARTTSTPTKKSAFDLGAQDEFGRISSRGSPRPPVQQQFVATAKKAAKKDGGKSSAKARAVAADDEQQDYGPPDGAFLPLSLERPRYEHGEGPVLEQPPSHDYGYLSYGRHVILGPEEVARLVDVVGEELGTRGLTTPFIFSTLALDVSSAAVKRLIQTFLNTCTKASSEADRQWRQEARLAGPHELGMALRWGLARVVRWVGGHQVRGLVSYDAYSQWRDSEAGACRRAIIRRRRLTPRQCSTTPDCISLHFWTPWILFYVQFWSGCSLY